MPIHASHIEGTLELFVYRLISVAVLDGSMYKGIEADKRATTQAATTVLLFSVAAGIGATGRYGVHLPTLVGTMALALVTWLAWAMLMFQIGPDCTGTSDASNLRRAAPDDWLCRSARAAPSVCNSTRDGRSGVRWHMDLDDCRHGDRRKSRARLPEHVDERLSSASLRAACRLPWRLPQASVDGGCEVSLPASSTTMSLRRLAITLGRDSVIAGLALGRHSAAYVARLAHGRIVGCLDVPLVIALAPGWRRWGAIGLAGKAGMRSTTAKSERTAHRPTSKRLRPVM